MFSYRLYYDIAEQMLIYKAEYEIIFRNDTGSKTHRYASCNLEGRLHLPADDAESVPAKFCEHVLGLVEVQPWVHRFCYLLDELAMVCKHSWA